jgi:integrase/recombinase XerD
VPVQRGARSDGPSSGRLLGEVADELLPAQRWSDPRMRLLVTGWLAGFRSPRTRRAYAGDLLAWQQWCDARSLDPLRARRLQADLYLADLLDGGSAPATAGRRLSALSSFYRFLIEQDDLDANGANL